MKKIFFYLSILIVLLYADKALCEMPNELKSKLILKDWVTDQIKIEENLGRMMIEEGENKIKQGEIILIQETVKKTSPYLIEKGEQLVAEGERLKKEGSKRTHQAQIRLRNNIKETKKREQEINKFLNEYTDTTQE